MRSDTNDIVQSSEQLGFHLRCLPLPYPPFRIGRNQFAPAPMFIYRDVHKARGHVPSLIGGLCIQGEEEARHKSSYVSYAPERSW